MAPSRGNQQRSLTSRASLLACLSLELLGFLMFAHGLWPVKTLLPGHSEPLEPHAEPAMSRLAFVLVDALRTDLALSERSAMSFTKQLVEDGRALAYTAISRPPTVTLPRLKAMTTGSSPAFLDAILNLQEEGQTQGAMFANIDSWVRQLRDTDPTRRMVFLGDDTWLRLFPRAWFVQADGVSSFLVSDYTSVDVNVSRHLPDLLAEPSWDILILHFLGLDHVGHAFGDSHALITSKQREMDAIVEDVWHRLVTWDSEDGRKSLMVLAGDHGMTPMGNHGGSSEPETSAALLLASPSFAVESHPEALHWSSLFRLAAQVEQVDLVPTISSLFGLGIPRNSMGRVILPVLQQAMNENSIHTYSRANLEQLNNLLHASGRLAATTLEAAQDDLLTAFKEIRWSSMVAGLALLSMGTLALFSQAHKHLKCTSGGFHHTLPVGIALFFFVSVASTSFIEEEHEIWFHVSLALSLMLFVRDEKPSWEWLALGASFRLLRAWSHNGQKTFSDNSLTLHLSRLPDSSLVLPTILGVCCMNLASLPQRPRILNLFNISQCLHMSSFHAWQALAAVHKTDKLDDASFYRRHYLLTGCALVSMYFGGPPSSSKKSAALSALATGLLGITKPSNAPLILLFWVQFVLLRRVAERHPLEQVSPLPALFIFSMQRMSFYAMGGSNSLATVDLSQAFKGLRSYDIRVVGPLTFLSNFALPILWSFAFRLLVSPLTPIMTYLAALQAGGLCSLVLATLVFREHLFIYTVFSPALLYRAVWSFVVHGIFEVLPYILLE